MNLPQTEIGFKALLSGLENCALCGARLSPRQKKVSIRRYQTLLCPEHYAERRRAEVEP